LYNLLISVSTRVCSETGCDVRGCIAGIAGRGSDQRSQFPLPASPKSPRRRAVQTRDRNRKTTQRLMTSSCAFNAVLVDGCPELDPTPNFFSHL